MCDTIAIVEPGRVLFAKNSDRDANEGQNLEWHPAADHASGDTVQCTYVAIPQAARTHAVLISRPFWMWGAEMGTNEHGVTIGNEAVFTKEPNEQTPGLIGMDLLRLALERSTTADAACEIITELMGEYGQGGGCGHESKNFTYHNSFIVADAQSAYVLETAGRKWALEPIQRARTISNGLTIPEFAERYSDTIKTSVSACKVRRERTQSLASASNSMRDLAALLRDHGPNGEHPTYHWTNGGLHAPCVHGGGVLANSQTTASWIAELRPGGAQHWVTGTSSPCISLFKPVSIHTPVEIGSRAEDVENDSLWWIHERLHRLVLQDPAALRPLFIPERDATEAAWFDVPPSSVEAFEMHRTFIAKWTETVMNAGPIRDGRDVRPAWARRYWAKRNARANPAIARA